MASRTGNGNGSFSCEIARCLSIQQRELIARLTDSLYVVDVLVDQSCSPEKAIVICGETHAKTEHAAQLGREFVGLFPFIGIETVGAAEMARLPAWFKLSTLRFGSAVAKAVLPHETTTSVAKRSGFLIGFGKLFFRETKITDVSQLSSILSIELGEGGLVESRAEQFTERYVDRISEKGLFPIVYALEDQPFIDPAQYHFFNFERWMNDRREERFAANTLRLAKAVPGNVMAILIGAAHGAPVVRRIEQQSSYRRCTHSHASN